MKRIITVLLCFMICILMMTACSNTQTDEAKANVEELHDLYIRAPKKVEKMTAVFSNTSNGETANIEMEIAEEDDKSVVFSCKADVNKYNMVHLTYDEKDSMDVAFNSFISGWYLEDDDILPYTKGTEPVYDPKFETKVFQFDGRDKNVYIWTPDDYDTKSSEKYSVIYMFDGQSVLATGTERGMDNDYVCWNVSESVTSMMSVTDNKAIIVAIDNGSPYRSDELVPDLGAIYMYEEDSQLTEEDVSLKRGSAFADFICDTVMPYIQGNYNVYTDAEHTSLAGSSLGGLETFYAVLAHPDKFGTGGVMSATFDMYADKEWTEFLKDKTDMKNAPLLYFYAGGYALDNGDVMETMNNKLVESGYPKDKLVFSKYEQGEHFIEYWRNIYPEFLEAAFTGNVTALDFGAQVKYEDTSDPYAQYYEDLELDLNELEPGYVYYDNSETKWDKVYAYWWGGPSINTITQEVDYFADWPGFPMQQVDDTDIYRVIAPFGVTGIIFDSGVTDKEVAEGKDAYQTTDLPYTHELIGKVYKIDMSVEPQADPGSMKTKRRYSAGDWSDYSPEK